MKILIVDDSKAMRMIVKRTLKQAGFGDHTVIEAENGAKALESIKNEQPNIVLADWNMPEMNGYELLTNINEQGIKVKFGFVTSEGTPDMKQKAQSAGAQFFITKPFTAETFARALSGVI